MNSNWTATASGLIVRNKPLISDGEQDWDSRLKLSPVAQAIFSSSNFQPTTSTEYRLGILPGYLFPRYRRSVQKVRVFAQACTFSGWRLHTPHLEVAFLAREAITNDEIMAIGQKSLIFMHSTVLIIGDSELLRMGCFTDTSWLYAYRDKPGRKARRKDGFAFIVSQIQN